MSREKEIHAAHTRGEPGSHMRLGFASKQELQRASVGGETRTGDLEVLYSHPAQSSQGC